jgi:hypothetical protein
MIKIRTDHMEGVGAVLCDLRAAGGRYPGDLRIWKWAVVMVNSKADRKFWTLTYEFGIMGARVTV